VKYAGVWTFDPGYKVIVLYSKDQRDREMYLVRGPGVHCPDLHRGAAWPEIRNGTAVVVSFPWKLCKECEHHTKGGYCAMLAKLRVGRRGPYESAVKKALALA